MRRRTNLHSGDVEIIEAAFGVDLGISGSTSVQGVVSAAMSPVNDKWAHQIVHGRVISTAEINHELATMGPDSPVALEIFGSSEAAAQAYWGGPWMAPMRRLPCGLSSAWRTASRRQV